MPIVSKSEPKKILKPNIGNRNIVLRDQGRNRISPFDRLGYRLILKPKETLGSAPRCGRRQNLRWAFETVGLVPVHESP